VRAAQLVLYKNASPESTKRALQFPRASLLEQLIFCFRVCEEQRQQQEAGKKNLYFLAFLWELKTNLWRQLQ
jgi:hypothetical protein